MDEPAAAALRADLLDQLALIASELEATRSLFRHLTVWNGRDRGSGRSVRECYGTMVDWDETLVLPLLQRISRGSAVVSSSALPDIERWNDVELDDILHRAQTARQSVVEFAAGLSAQSWRNTVMVDSEKHDVFGLLYRVIRHDVKLLQQVTQRLQQSI